MTIAFCHSCNHLLSTGSPGDVECPFCAAPLSEAQEVIAPRGRRALERTVLASHRALDSLTGARRQRLLRV